MAKDTRPTPGAGVVILWLGGGFLAVALILGMLLVAGSENQTMVLDWLTSVLLLITSGASVTAVVQSRKTNVKLTAQDTAIAKIDDQTNGKLDARIKAAIQHVLDTVKAQEGGTS